MAANATIATDTNSRLMQVPSFEEFGTNRDAKGSLSSVSAATGNRDDIPLELRSQSDRERTSVLEFVRQPAHPHCTSTDKNGLATLKFTPKVEKSPGKGLLTTYTGTITARPQFIGSFSSDDAPAILVDIFGEALFMPWRISAHVAPGFKFTTAQKTFQIVPLPRNGWDNRTMSWQVDAQACGEDMWRQQWSLVVTQGQYKREFRSAATLFLDDNLTGTATSAPPRPGGDPFMVSNFEVRIVGDPPTTAEMTFLNGPVDEWPDWAGTISVPIEVDSACEIPPTGG